MYPMFLICICSIIECCNVAGTNKIENGCRERGLRSITRLIGDEHAHYNSLYIRLWIIRKNGGESGALDFTYFGYFNKWLCFMTQEFTTMDMGETWLDTNFSSNIIHSF